MNGNSKKKDRDFLVTVPSSFLHLHRGKNAWSGRFSEPPRAWKQQSPLLLKCFAKLPVGRPLNRLELIDSQTEIF